MATAITPEQLVALASNTRHKNLCIQGIKEIATYLRTQDGTTNNTAGRTPVGWAKVRSIAGSIAQHPNSQDYGEWTEQMSQTLKGQPVWDGVDEVINDANLNATVDFLIDNGKYDEITNLIYDLRSQRIEF